MAPLDDWAESDLLAGKAVGYRFASGHLQSVVLGPLLPALRDVNVLVHALCKKHGPLVGYEFEKRAVQAKESERGSHGSRPVQVVSSQLD